MPATPQPLFGGLEKIVPMAPDIFRKLGRPSLLMLTAGVAGLSAIANAVAVAAPAEQAPATRLGTSIQQSVRERDQALAQQKRALELREQAARASEERLKADMQARQAAPQRPGSPAAADAAPQSEPYDELARIYQTMKPAKAAPIFERLDLDVQTEVARRMRERSTALIMSNMSAGAAVQLSMALAGKKVVKPQPVVVAARDPEPSKRQAAREKEVGQGRSARAPKASRPEVARKPSS
ncbi:MotE family protein [Sphingomonas sp. LaA6.9]|uniref:MotE family protein n=1 Tax=Sphingomonas sp. LaA6.9 TaxID=2919914 RepID=UPI001F4FF0B4|nr:magnesium transporter [Sphingomonas sp. LaA6.9]MCJ8157714.1 magnesium transporter [Sphingomonas sp. LaA6.9]